MGRNQIFVKDFLHITLFFFFFYKLIRLYITIKENSTVKTGVLEFCFGGVCHVYFFICQTLV